MDHEQMAVELSKALAARSCFRIYWSRNTRPRSLRRSARRRRDAAGLSKRAMWGAGKNVEKLTGRRSMTIGEFAKFHADQLNTCWQLGG